MSSVPPAPPVVDPATITIEAPALVVAPAATTSGDAPKPRVADSITTVKSPETVLSEAVARENEALAAVLRTAGQRKVNMIWEYTQAAIAISVVIACILAAFWLDPSKSEILRNAFFLIVGFYFGRTNHQAIGGVGNKEPLIQSGR